MIIITTVGTSLLTNLLKKNVDKCFGVSLGDSENLKEKIGKGTATKEDLNDINFCGFIDGQLANEKQLCRNFILKDTNYPDINLNASAEIKSICKIANGKPATVYLLATDTFMSEFAAEKIREALDGRNSLIVNFEKVNHRIKDLSIDDPKKFEQKGFENLINTIDVIYKNHKKDEIILNISGGYKALIPFLTIYGQIRNLPLMYIYEDSEELIEIKGKYLNFNIEDLESLAPLLDNNFLRTKNKNTEEINAIDRLKDKNLIDNNNKKTVLGRILEKEAEQKANVTKGAFGTIVELKLLERYMVMPFEFDNRKYRVERSKKILSGNDRAEIDLFFKNKDNNDIIFMEVKSYLKMLKRKNEIKDDMQKRIGIAKNNNYNLKKYILLIYKAVFHRLERFNTYFNELKQITDNENVAFQVYYIDIDTYPKHLGYNMDGFLHKDTEKIKIELCNYDQTTTNT